MTREFHEAALVTRSALVSWCDLGEEIVVLRVADQAYYRLRASARDLWLSLEHSRTVQELVTAMQEAHAGVAAEIAKETRAFVDECSRLGLVSVSRNGT